MTPLPSDPAHHHPPSFLDAADRLKYLTNTHLTANTPIADLQRIRRDLLLLLHMQPLHDAAQCQQALYAASLLATADDLLRHARPASAKIVETSAIMSVLRDPLEWTAVRVLLAPNGEQHLPQVLAVYERMLPADVVVSKQRQLLERVVSSVGQRQSAVKFPAQRLLDRIAQLPDLNSMRAVVENMVRLRHIRSDGLRLKHLLEILRTPSDDLARHQLACLVFQRFVQVLVEPQVFGVFVRHLVSTVLDTGEGRAVFHDCLRLGAFYEVLVAGLGAFLQAVRIGTLGEDRECFCTTTTDTTEMESMRVADVRRIVWCLLHRDSPVRRKFAEHLRGVRMAEAVRKAVTQTLVYD